MTNDIKITNKMSKDKMVEKMNNLYEKGQKQQMPNGSKTANQHVES